MIVETIPEIAKLSREQIRILSAELWCLGWDEEIDAGRDAAIGEVLNKRWEEYNTDPNGVVTYEGLRKRYGLDD